MNYISGGFTLDILLLLFREKCHKPVIRFVKINMHT